MDLDAWIALTPAERNAHRLEWKYDVFSTEEPYWHKLLEAARKRFEGEFGGHPQVYAVDCWRWDMGEVLPTPRLLYFEPTICISTALYPPQQIEELPSRYATFAVVQEQMELNKEITISIWTQALGELLSWSEAQVLEWATQHEDGLNGRDGCSFYHESAYYYIGPLLIPDQIRACLQYPGTAFGNLATKISTAIEIDGKAPLFIPDYDWDAARQRINVILENATA